jgi:hypothetical protein
LHRLIVVGLQPRFGVSIAPWTDKKTGELNIPGTQRHPQPGTRSTAGDGRELKNDPPVEKAQAALLVGSR